MDDLWTMTLLGQEEPSLWRMLTPVIVIGVFAVVRWLNEKAKQREREQQAEDDARRQREDEGGASRAEPVLPEQAQRTPKTPLPPQARHQQRPGAAQPIRGYDPRIAPAPGSREAARKAETVRHKTTKLKPSGQLSPQTTDPGRELFQAKTALLARGQTISQPQIRRAIVWAEILGPPRAVRPYEELF